jgi:hypothetical protein
VAICTMFLASAAILGLRMLTRASYNICKGAMLNDERKKRLMIGRFRV